MAKGDAEPMRESGTPAETRRDLEVNKLFRLVMKHEGSDLHLKAGMPPLMRLKGIMRRLGTKSLTQEELEHLIRPMLTEDLAKELHDTGGADYSYVVGEDECRFRVNVFKQRGQLSLVARRVLNQIPSFEKLYLPASLKKLCQLDQGLIILAGPTGSGKSTTIAAMLEYINEHEHVHILTLEDPVEFSFTDKKAVVNQREIGLDVRDWKVALKHAVRQDPDVILLGEMRDRETFEAGIQTAETGHLVFGTIHAFSAASAVSRILDLFPADMHNAVRHSLAFHLRAVIAQKLLPSIKPDVQRVPALEIMIVNPTVRDLILKGEENKLPDAIRIGIQEGMIDFNESLLQLVNRGEVDEETALNVAPNPEVLKMNLKGIRISQPGIL